MRPPTRLSRTNIRVAPAKPKAKAVTPHFYLLDKLNVDTDQADANQANATMCFGPIPSRVAD